MTSGNPLLWEGANSCRMNFILKDKAEDNSVPLSNERGIFYFLQEEGAYHDSG